MQVRGFRQSSNEGITNSVQPQILMTPGFPTSALLIRARVPIGQEELNSCGNFGICAIWNIFKLFLYNYLHVCMENISKFCGKQKPLLQTYLTACYSPCFPKSSAQKPL